MQVSKESGPGGKFGDLSPGARPNRRHLMDTRKPTAPSTRKDPGKKTRREVWHPPLTAEKRAERVRLARAFLEVFGD